MHCSQLTQYSTTPVHSAETITLTSLIPDVLPNIFSRLPVSDLLNFGRLNKEARQTCATLLIPEAIRLFDDFNVDDCQNSLARLGAFFRNGCANITDQNWQALLNKTAANGIDHQLLEVLLFACTPENIVAPTIPALLKLQEEPSTEDSPWDSFTDPEYDSCRYAARESVFQISAMEMFEVARCNNNPTTSSRSIVERRGWTKLTALFEECNTDSQVRILSCIQPRNDDASAIHLAFEELVIAHIRRLEEDRGFVFGPENYLKECVDAYHTVLADFYALAPAAGERACFLSIFSKSPSNFPYFLHWKKSTRGTSTFAFRLLAAEIRGNKSNKLQSRAQSFDIEKLALPTFISRKDLDHFAKKLNARMDRGMTLEHAVSKWLDDSAAGKCAVS